MPRGRPKKVAPPQGEIVSLYKPGVSDQELIEEDIERDPEIVVTRADVEKSLEKPKVDPMKLPGAVLTAKTGTNVDQAIAKKTCKKFIGRWIDLTVGKPVVATKDAIDILRAGGYVE